jgi:hypothetical protein
MNDVDKVRVAATGIAKYEVLGRQYALSQEKFSLEDLRAISREAIGKASKALGMEGSKSLASEQGKMQKFIETQLRLNTTVTSETAIVVVDKSDEHKEWYAEYCAQNESADTRWESYQRQLQDYGWPAKVIDSINLSSSKIVELLGNPQVQGISFDRRGMVIGNVQSGKTANMTAVIAKAIDAGYLDIIVLAGAWNNLRTQTQKRFEYDLVGHTSDEGNRILVGVGKMKDKAFLSKIVPMTTRESDFGIEQAKALGAHVHTKKTVRLFVIKKHLTVLENLRNFLEHGITDEIGQRPTLVIDDECDHYSINTAKRYGVDGEAIDPTRTNSEIRKLLKLFKRVSFIGYTATPFANIFIAPRSETEEEGLDLFPRHFISVLRPPSNYVGIRKMLGDGLDEGDGTYSLIEDGATWVPVGLKKGDSISGEWPPSFRCAVLSFFLGVAARWARKQHDKPSSMLVHVHTIIDVHAQVEEQVSRLIALIVYDLRTSGEEGSSVWCELRELWDNEFIPKSTMIDDREPGLGLSPLPWKLIKEQLEILARKQSKVGGILKVIQSNSRGDGVDDWSKEGGKAIILIGGHKLSRGITLEGLLVSYFLKTTKKPAYDTLMQMGRWFGYRDGFRDLCRLFAERRMIELFRALVVSDEDVRAQIEDLSAQSSKTPMDVGLYVRTHPGMSVSAPNKLRGAGQKIRISYWGKVTSFLHYSTHDSIREKNMKALSRLLGGREICNSVAANVSLFSKVDKQDIVRFLQAYAEPDDITVSTSSSIVKNLLNAKAEGYANDWVVGVSVGKTNKNYAFDGYSALRDVLGNSRLRFRASKGWRRGAPLQINALSGSNDRGLDLNFLRTIDQDFARNYEARLEEVNKRVESGNHPCVKPGNPFVELTGNEAIRIRPKRSGYLLVHLLKEENDAQPSETPLVGLTVILPEHADSDVGDEIMVNELWDDNSDYRE